MRVKEAIAGLVAALPRIAEPVQDRAVAEWTLRAGGSIAISGRPGMIWDVADLPSGEIRLHTLNLVGTVVPIAELAKIAGLAHLKELYLSGRFWRNVPVRQCPAHWSPWRR